MSSGPLVEHVDVDLDELRRRLSASPLSDEDKAMFGAVVDTLASVTEALESKRCSIARLRRLVFGAKTEKLRNLDPPRSDETSASEDCSGATSSQDGAGQTAASDVSEPPGACAVEKRKTKGHGRNGASNYPGAMQHDVPHDSLKPNDPCPCGCGGKVRPRPPRRHLRLRGNAPITGDCFNLGQLRCDTCGEVFEATLPDEVGNEKYDATAMAIVALLKYGAGFPFSRLARLQASAGVPLAPATQWDLCERSARRVVPVFLRLVALGGQGDLLYVDDTSAKILGVVRRLGESRESAAMRAQQLDAQELLLPLPPPRPETRTGTFTTGVVSEVGAHTVVLYLTGWCHAGDNLEHVLSHRDAELPLPIQMCDALSRNTSGEFATILANCLTHARREFVDIMERFKEPCLHVIRQLASVYKYDADARKLELSAEQRLAWHQQHSGPIMAELHDWMKTEVAERRIEPNSALGGAIEYMQKHWVELTRFLSVAGAPLDNNLCERILKRAILHRKNSLFFRTARGARVADIFMTLIQTAELAKKDPLHYLTTLLEHHEQVAMSPDDWLPWNYEQTVARCQAAAA